MASRQPASERERLHPTAFGIVLTLGAAGLAASCARPPNAPGSRAVPAAPSTAGIPDTPVAAPSVVADVLRLRMVHEADSTELSAITLDPRGAPVVGGGLNVERPGEHGAFVSKLEADGDPAWTASLQGNASVTGLVADPSGNVWVAGWYRGALDAARLSLASRGNDRDGFVAKLSPTGSVLTLARFGDGSYHAATAITIEPSGRT